MAEPVETPIGTVTAENFRPGHVRHQIVVGPKFLYALFDSRDQMHPVSRAFWRLFATATFSIVDEAATRLKKQASMRNAASFVTTLDEDTLYQFESVSEDVFADATAMFIEWTDLDASFTDFVVAAHMDELDVDYILTYNRHYDAFDVTTLPYRSQS